MWVPAGMVATILACQFLRSNDMKIGWIGIGHMGKPMATHVFESGHEFTVHDLRREAATDLLEAGASWADSPAELARDKDMVLTCLPKPLDVESACLEEQGVIEGIARDTVLIDCSTNALATVRRLHEAFDAAGVPFMDCPVSGGVRGALARDLCVMAGGDEAVYKRAKPVLDAMGDKVMYCGPAGSGTICKLMNQLFSALISQSAAEVLTAGVKAGVPLATLMEAMSRSTSAKNPPLQSWREGNVSNDFEADELTFFLELSRKDIRLACEVGRDHDVPMDLANIVEQNMIEAMNRGWGRKQAAVVRLLQQERAKVDLSKA